MRAVEQVAELAGNRGARAAWLLRAASLAGEGEEGSRQRFDVLLRAVSLMADPTTLMLLGDAARDVLKYVPEERDVLSMRLASASGALTKKLDGPDGARVALAFAELGLDLFEDAEGALLAFERALGADGDLDEFARLLPRATLLASSPTAGEFITRALAAAERPYANVGPPALKVIAAIAAVLGDHSGRARALTLAVERDSDDDALVCAADTAIWTNGDDALRARFAKKIDAPRWVEAWRGQARMSWPRDDTMRRSMRCSGRRAARTPRFATSSRPS